MDSLQGLHIAADFKLLLQHEYNRAVTANPTLYFKRNIAAHLFGRAVYIFTTFIWPWLVFETWTKCVLFSTVPIVVFSLAFMINSQINHLTPDTAHAQESNYYRHQIVTAQDFGEGSVFHRGFCFFMSGGLNYQIEHHLFPTVCHCHLSALKPIVRRLCAKHSVPYHQRAGYWEALEEHFVHSHMMGAGKYERDAPAEQQKKES
jgi:fatty acid desaturase